MVFHVLNRAVGRRLLFRKEPDYEAFCRVLAEAVDRTGMRLLGFCLMPNHWHLLLWPRRDGDVSGFVRWLTTTHGNRYHAHYRTAGEGHVYQGRFKSFPVQDDRHLLIAWRYVERNAVRAGLVRKAEAWPWCSAAVRAPAQDGAEPPPWAQALLSEGPVDLPRNWAAIVNEPQTAAEERAVRASIARGAPLGDEQWAVRTAGRLAISLRPRGRPRKKGS